MITKTLRLFTRLVYPTNHLTSILIGTLSVSTLCLPVAAQSTFNSASIAVRSANPSGEVDIAVWASDNSLRYYFALPGNPWQSTMIDGPGSTLSTPSIAVRPNGEADIVVHGPNNSVVYYSARPGTAWTKSVIPGATTWDRPAIAIRPSGLVDIIVRTPNNSLRDYFQRPGGWTSTTIAGSNNAFSAPGVAIQSNGVVDVVVQGWRNSLTFFHDTGIPGSSWKSSIIAGANSTYSAPAIAVRANGEHDVVVRGPSNSLVYYRPTLMLNIHTGLTWISRVIAGTNTTYSDPSMVVRAANPSDETDIVVNGPNLTMKYYYCLTGVRTWNSAVITNTGLQDHYFTPTIVVRSVSPVGEADVISINVSGQLIYAQALPGASWSLATIAP